MSLSAPLIAGKSFLWRFDEIQTIAELKRKVHAIFDAHKNLGFPLAKSQRDQMRTIPKNHSINHLALDKTILIAPDDKLYVIVETLKKDSPKSKCISKILDIETAEYKILVRWSFKHVSKENEANRYAYFVDRFKNIPGCLKIDFLHCYEGNGHLKQMMIVKFYSGRDLTTLDDTVGYEARCDICFSLASALQGLHKRNVIYGDIRLKDLFYENIEGNVSAVFGDFSHFYHEGKKNNRGHLNDELSSIFPIDSSRNHFGKPDDVWSLGLIFCQILDCDLKFKTLTHQIIAAMDDVNKTNDPVAKIRKNIATAELRSVLDAHFEPLLQLCSQMLHSNPSQRPIINQVIEVFTLYYRDKERDLPSHINKTLSCCSII